MLHNPAGKPQPGTSVEACVSLTLPGPTPLLELHLTPSGPSLSFVSEAGGSLGSLLLPFN